ncbi:MAG: adenylyltransferase/cytidyltransferase family protein [Thermoplasmatota archaeon]
MRAVVVGRFQPLHNGHLALIGQAEREGAQVVIGVGSSTASETPKNPFTFVERQAMLEAALPGRPVVAIPDIHDDDRWVAHALSLTGPVERAYGNDRRTLDLFERAGVQVGTPGLVHRKEWEGRRIRLQMRTGDPAWRAQVPGPVALLLDAWNAPGRLAALGPEGP